MSRRSTWITTGASTCGVSTSPSCAASRSARWDYLPSAHHSPRHLPIEYTHTHHSPRDQVEYYLVHQKDHAFEHQQRYHFSVPGVRQKWRWGFYTCNGFHDQAQEAEMGGIQPMWRDVLHCNRCDRGVGCEAGKRKGTFVRGKTRSCVDNYS